MSRRFSVGVDAGQDLRARNFLARDAVDLKAGERPHRLDGDGESVSRLDGDGESVSRLDGDGESVSRLDGDGESVSLMKMRPEDSGSKS